MRAGRSIEALVLAGGPHVEAVDFFDLFGHAVIGGGQLQQHLPLLRIQHPLTQPEQFYRLVTNGYSMSATTVIGKRYMKLYVYLPLALRSSMDPLVGPGLGQSRHAADVLGMERTHGGASVERIVTQASIVLSRR